MAYSPGRQVDTSLPVLSGSDACACAFLVFAVAHDATIQGLFSHCLKGLFVSLFLPALGLHCFTRAFSSCAEWTFHCSGSSEASGLQ